MRIIDLCCASSSGQNPAIDFITVAGEIDGEPGGLRGQLVGVDRGHGNQVRDSLRHMDMRRQVRRRGMVWAAWSSRYVW